MTTNGHGIHLLLMPSCQAMQTVEYLIPIVVSDEVDGVAEVRLFQSLLLMRVPVRVCQHLIRRQIEKHAGVGAGTPERALKQI